MALKPFWSIQDGSEAFLEHPGWLQSLFGASRMALKPSRMLQKCFKAILDAPAML